MSIKIKRWKVRWTITVTTDGEAKSFPVEVKPVGSSHGRRGRGLGPGRLHGPSEEGF
jgi:hypothetical protein